MEPADQSQTPSSPMNAEPLFTIQFWGVRGGIPTPGKDTVQYGGNTCCMELRVGGQCLIFDGGTGLRVLGNHLLRQMPVEAHLFFTHYANDRIQGFPFFVPGFIPGNRFHLYGDHTRDYIAEHMTAPNFPVPLEVMRSELKFQEFTAGDTLKLGEVQVQTCLINDSTQAIGYRITYNGCSVVYATDADFYQPYAQKSCLDLAGNADLLIVDGTCAATVTHSDHCWQSSLQTAKQLGVKKIIMFPHDPEHDDEFLGQLEAQMQTIFPNSLLAREKMVISL